MLMSLWAVMVPTPELQKLWMPANITLPLHSKNVSRFHKKRWNFTKKWQRCTLEMMYPPTSMAAFPLNTTALELEPEQL